MTSQRFGAHLIIFTFVLTQFLSVEFTPATADGGFVLTLDKIAAVVVLPPALMLIGHIRASAAIFVSSSLLGIAYVAANLSSGGLAGDKPLAVYVFVLGGTFGALCLYTALCVLDSPFRSIARVWIGMAVATSLVAVPQSVGLIPLWAASSRTDLAESVPGFVRATGFSSDPNYAAVSLVIAVVFAYFYAGRYRWFVLALLLLGIAATFSRMGLIMGLALCALLPLLTDASLIARMRTRKSMVLRVAVFLGAAAALYSVAAPPQLKEFTTERMEDASAMVERLGGGPTVAKVGQTSGEERLVLLNAAAAIIRDHPLAGVGAFNIETAVQERTGVRRTIHNLYLEMLVTGGGLGALTLIFAGTMTWRSAWLARTDPLARACVLSLLIAFAVMALTLSLTYNALLWVPLVMALALRHVHKRIAPAPRTRSGPQKGWEVATAACDR